MAARNARHILLLRAAPTHLLPSCQAAELHETRSRLETHPAWRAFIETFSLGFILEYTTHVGALLHQSGWIGWWLGSRTSQSSHRADTFQFGKFRRCRRDMSWFNRASSFPRRIQNTLSLRRPARLSGVLLSLTALSW
jgi:hypothetical protein